MNNMKYIIFDNGMNDFPIIFPNFIEHLAIAQMHSEWTPIRAGFIAFDWDGGLNCFGNSFSLKLESNSEIDNKLINKALGYKG